MDGVIADDFAHRFFARSAFDNLPATFDSLCGATLVWSDILVTAAHCHGVFNHGVLFYDPVTKSYTKRRVINHQQRHPGWEFNGLAMDVMVLRLATPISEESDFQQPVSMNTDPTQPIAGSTLKVFGFGRTEHAWVPRSLRMAQVQYISNAQCRQMVSSSGLENNIPPLPEHVLCTTTTETFGSASTSTCFGDSGGPLTSVDGTTLMGIISFAAQCTADIVPNGYTRVSLIEPWVQDQICALSQNPPEDCVLPSENDSNNNESDVLVELELIFIHDFYPEETLYYIRNSNSQEVVYTGPQYVPQRNGQWRVPIFLPPGNYQFEIYDKRGNGLRSAGQGFGDGRWQISAVYTEDYDDNTKDAVELASGGHEFLTTQITDFFVEDRSGSASGANDIAKNSLGKTTVKIGGNAVGGAEARRRRPNGRVRGLIEASSSSLPEPKIINGTRADPSFAPFFAKAAGDELNWTPDRLCGATLIHADILVTAAHCQGAFNYGVLLYDAESNGFTQRATIDKQSRHPLWDFSPSAWNYDVLVLRLSTPIAGGDAPVPIALNQDNGFPAHDDNLLALGFGVTEEGGSSKFIRTAEMQYINNTECVERMNTFGKLNLPNLPSEFLCTSSESTASVCDGDSGGPLTNANGTALAGIVSFGSGCSANEFPNIHVRVSQVWEWLKEQVCALSMEPPEDCEIQRTSTNASLVELSLIFVYDFFAEDIIYVIRDTEDRAIVFSGPIDVPQRNGRQKTAIFLPPGDYTFEVLDRRGNGLNGMGAGQGNGWWRLSALYDGEIPTELATGDHAFQKQQLTAFTVGGPPSATGGVDQLPSRPSLADKDGERLGGHQHGSSERLRRQSQGSRICLAAINAIVYI